MAEGSKSRLALDLDQIERQLRSSQQAAPSKSDPLAELARIVGQDDPFRALLAEQRAPAAHARAPAMRQPGYAEASGAYAARPVEMHHAPGQPYAPADVTQDEAAVLYAQNGQAYAYAEDQPGYYEADESAYEAPQDGFEAAEPRRSRKGLIAVAVLGLAVLGGAGFFALRGGERVLTAGGEPPVVRADTGPSKVAPLNPGGIDIPNQNKQIYERNLQDSQTRVVNGEEQPIDVRQIGRGPGSGAAGASGSGGVADVLGEPRRVRTVSIRPDGAVIGAEPAPAQRASAPAFPQAPATSRAEPLPPPSVPAAATAMAPISAAAAASPQAPLSILPPQRPRDVTATPSSSRVAGTPSSSIDAQPGAPLQITPDASRSRPDARAAGMAASLREPTETSAAPAPAAGGFLVQLGVRASDGDARTEFDRLQQRHPIELSGFAPIIRQAESNGRTIYRIRIGPMSKQDADALCARLKAANGQCFVPRPES